MRYKLKEPKKLIAAFLIIYIILSVCFIANNFSKRTKEVPGEITGKITGTVRINITSAAPVVPAICSPPSAPTLNDVENTRDTSVTMSWTSHKNSTQFDQFVFDSESTVTANSPQTRTHLTKTEHTWKVRTCNPSCCSIYASDTFKVLISHPAPPTGIVVKEIENITPAKPTAPEIRTPSPIKITLRDIIQNLLRISYLMLTLIVSLILFIILWKKHDEDDKKKKQKKLEEYVNNALKLGFNEAQIREKITSSGVTKEEINKIFDKIR